MAIVTGAASGDGEALAAAIAAQGTHVVLVARSVDRLTALAWRIEGVRVPLEAGHPFRDVGHRFRRKPADLIV